jgi:hypothetical protein
MTTTATPYTPRKSRLDRAVAMRLAAAEYQRFIDVLGALSPDDWSTPTECPDWDVRAMAAHALGMAEMAASVREQMRQVKTATKRGGVFIDALTRLQVEERQDMTPAQIVAKFQRIAPKASRGRRLTPGLIRRRTMPQLQVVGDHEEPWTIGYLVDVILTRDPWSTVSTSAGPPARSPSSRPSTTASSSPMSCRNGPNATDNRSR